MPRGAIIIVIDALRADHLGAYGYARKTSPNIDALAADGTRFANTVTTAPWTLPAMATLWTSLYPSVHGALRRSNEMQWVHDRQNFHPYSILDDSRTTLAEVLHSNGFATAAFVDGCYPSRVFGFGQGFDIFEEDALYGARLNTEALLQWLDETKPRRFFGYVHMVEVHSPYTAPGDPIELIGRTDAAAEHVRHVLDEERGRYKTINFDPGYTGPINGSMKSLDYLRAQPAPPDQRAQDIQHLIATYDRGIAYDDYWIGQLIQGLKQRGLYDQTLFVVTADHGEEFSDHGGFEHGGTLYDELLRIPLIIRMPGRGAGVVRQEQVGLIDVMPTMLDLLGVPHTVPLQGNSLAPALAGGTLPDRMFFGEADQSLILTALRTNKLKYIQRGEGLGPQAYDLQADPQEKQNLCTADEHRCAEFAATVKNWRREMRSVAEDLNLASPPTAVIDERTRERMRALGYDR